MDVTHLPRLLDNTGNFIRLLYPLSASVTLKLTPLSTASMEFPEAESIPLRSLVEVYTPIGSAGIFRTRAPQNAYGSTTSVELEHAITELGDYLVREKISKMMGATEAVKKLFGYYGGKLWQLGAVTGLGATQIAVDVNYDGVLDAILEVLKQKTDCVMTFDFSSTPWKVNFVKKETVVTAEGRLSRNVKSARITTDDSELCTVLYYDKTGKDKWTSKKADTQKTYGTIQRTVSTNSSMTDAEIAATVDTYLSEHQEPKVTVEIDAEDLSDITGEALDTFTVGKLFRLALPDYGMTVKNTVTQVNWRDVYNDPRSMTVTLGNEADTVVSFIHKTSSGGGGGKAKKDQEDKWKEYTTKIEQTDKDISLWAKQTDQANNILAKAGIKISADGVITYAVNKKNGNYLTSYINQKADSITQKVTDQVNGLKSELKIERNRISLIVSGSGDNAKVKAKVIVDAINDGTVKIEGNHVKLSSNTSFTSLVGDVEGIHSSGIWQHRDSIDLIAGKFTWNESQQRLRLVDGAKFQVAKDGVFSTVGTVKEIDAVDDKVDEITGSTIWQQRDNITLAAGKLTVDSDGNLHVKNGSALYVGEGSSSLGVYTSGNLTAGVIVDKINGGTVTINAARVDINGIVSALQTRTIECGPLYCSNLTVFNAAEFQSGIDVTGVVSATGFECGTDTATWQSTTVVTSVSPSKTTSRRWAYLDGQSTAYTASMQLVSNVSVTTDTIHYLGY